ncbi:putative ionotropic glutamate receptor [Rosa chinensis]|uniref:Putative ionotropic glutamate receptor n=1 Tax=Rosa chinensis TaxID=74649 RepID=A0A2P6PQJ1_ROSCH|nr:putative ionotropic glutamate receptor [Rosa chinensis]
MIIWVFVMLILTQSYTASLTSLLTVQQLHPIVTDVRVLLRNGETVGYAENTFVYNVLRQGSANGGIAAVVDEIPNMKLFLVKYCSKYTMIGPIFKTDGFAFVFPKRSPLVPDVSRAVLNVTEGEVIMNLENKWFNRETSCQDLNMPKLSSNSLGLDSFRGLFIIFGVASILALIIFVASFLYKHRHVLVHSDSTACKWRRIQDMLKKFNEKDFDSHTFKGSQQ